MTSRAATSGSSQGPAVDQTGTPVIDPTENVKNILEAAVKRLDDLRAESITTRDREIAHVKDLMALRGEYTEKLLNQQAENIEKLQIAEAKRIDAIRAVDVNAVSVASERAAAAANVLASQVTASAETLRALVATTAATQAQQSAQQVAQLSDRLAALEKSANEGIGRGRVVDPQLDAMLTKIDRMSTQQTQTDSTRGGGQQMIGWIVGGIMFLVAVAVFVIPHLK